jgi:hypothetical protein
MSDNPRYQIFPKELDLKPIPQIASVPLDDWEKKNIKGLSGCAGFILFVVVLVAGVAIGTRINAPGSATAPVLLAAAIIVALVHLAFRWGNITVKEREKAQQTKQSIDQINKNEISVAEREAQGLTSALTRTYESSATLAVELPQHLSRAADCLRQAESEFKDNAFGPFWDAVENAAQQLAAFNGKAIQISRQADEYYRTLNGKTHTFPSFPANDGNIPNPSSVVSELRRMVRMGQTNFQFANIWEHRRTREVMIAGFRTLGDAVNNLGSTVENSLFGLQQSISSDVATLVREQIKTRDSLDKRMVEQNRMLDNIQQHRKPGTADRPSRY